MKARSLVLTIIFVAAYAAGCGQDHYKADYMPLLREMHSIECAKLDEAGISKQVNDTSIYAFRTRAFDKIMTHKPDAKLIARYEELNQKLAAMEYVMDAFEKKTYQNDFKEVYMLRCP